MVRGGRDMRAWIAFAFGFDSRLRVRERAARDGSAARARSAGRCSRSTWASKSGSCWSWSSSRPRSPRCGPQRGGRAPARVRGLGRRHRGGHVLVRSTRLLSWRHVMKRVVVVLGVLVAVGALSLGGRRLPAAPAAAAAARKVVEVEKLKDNLYMLQGRRRQHRRVRRSERRHRRRHQEPGLGPADPRQDQGAHADKPVTTIINTHTHGDHVSGNVEFPATVDIVVQENTTDEHEEDDAGHRPARRPRAHAAPTIFEQNGGKGLPKRTFKDKMTIGKRRRPDRSLLLRPRPHQRRRLGRVPGAARRARRRHLLGQEPAAPRHQQRRQRRRDRRHADEGARGVKNVDTIITGHSTVMTWDDLKNSAPTSTATS